MRGKLVVCVFNHKHGVDAIVSATNAKMGTAEIEKAVERDLIEEYGKADYEEDKNNYGGLEYHHALMPSIVEGLDGEHYKIEVTRIDARVECKFCKKHTPAPKAHLHQNGYVCEKCWDERLRVTE